MNADIRLLHMADGRGAVPLSYVRKDFWGAWIDFLKTRQSVFWPKRSASRGGHPSPPLTLHGPDSRPLPDPDNALSPRRAAMLVSGRVTAENVRSDLECYGQADDDDDDDTNSFASEYDDHDDTCCTTDTLDMNEMENILRQLSHPA